MQTIVSCRARLFQKCTKNKYPAAKADRVFIKLTYVPHKQWGIYSGAIKILLQTNINSYINYFNMMGVKFRLDLPLLQVVVVK